MVMSSAAFAVNYGEAGHNPGNPTNNGQGGPPVQSGGGNNNGGTPSVGNNTLTNVQGQMQRQTAVGVGIGVSTSESVSGATAVGVGGSATGGAAQAGAATGPVSVTNNIGGDSGDRRYTGKYTVRSTGVAPDIVANPTAPCRVAVGVSGGWIGGALGLSGSVLDEGCDARADATMLVMMGYEGAAAARLCQKPEMAKALGTLVCPAEQKTFTATSNASLFKH